jgi:hypothetical protein
MCCLQKKTASLVLMRRFCNSAFACVLAAAVCSVPASAQASPSSGRDFPAARFDSLDRIAFYLWQYDSFAWATTDTLNSQARSFSKDLIDRIGEEWFCYKRDSTWHAVYGKFDEANDRYDAVVHYVSSGQAGITRSPDPPDMDFANRAARALFMAKRHARIAPQSDVRFNSYVREREDGGLDVWYVPAWQSNGWLVYGAQYQYTFDREGRTVRDSLVRIGSVRAQRPDKSATVQLMRDEPGIATVAELLFIHLYTKHFAHVRVYTRDWMTELLDKDGEKAWFHVLRSGPRAVSGIP